MEAPRFSRSRALILAALLIAVGIIAYADRDNLIRAAYLIGAVSAGWLVLAAAAIAIVYLCRAAVYQVSLALLDHTFSIPYLTATALVATSLHQLIPSGGASGYAFLAYAFHRRGVSTGEASLVALVDTLSNAVSIGTLVVVSLVYLAISGDLAGTGLAAVFAPGVAAITLAAYAYHLQRDREAFTGRVLLWKNRLGSLFGRRWADPPVQRFLDQFYDSKNVIARHPRSFLIMVGFQYLAIVCDCVALYAVFLALGITPPAWVVFMGLVVSMAGLAVIAVPGGGGSFEVIMSAFFSANQVPTAIAIAATILYRIVAFWLPVLASLFVMIRLRWRQGATTAQGG